ncbi:hypothetical protein ACFV11_20170 [Streptomyces globisporus]|uniref:competence protein CoiA family protein n=1 Tax=Streptomyces globisporus TaxID=1908 RepID=UPI0036A7D381
MANGVFHTGYRIKIELTHPDLGHPDRPGLLDEITQPIDKRERELLQCLQHYELGRCQAEDHDRSPWMAIRRRTAGGRTTLVAAHLPVRHQPTAEESDKHKAMKERIARAAERNGLSARVEARSPDGRVRTDVLVTGKAGAIGWEAQYAPITASTVRRRSQAAAAHGIIPLWLTNSDRAALIDRAPWAAVNDVPWQAIASRQAMLVRAGVRHLQRWKCSRSSDRRCPVTNSDYTACGRLHVQWDLPALCIPQKRHTEVDQLVAASAEGAYVPMRIPNQRDPRSFSRMWVPNEDRDEWQNIVGPAEDPAEEETANSELTFTEEALDHTCRYGEETMVFNDRRLRRATGDATGLHTFDEIPQRLFKIPQQSDRQLDITPQQRREAGALHGCADWNIGPCAGCATPIHRYGPGGAHACGECRARVTGRTARRTP